MSITPGSSEPPKRIAHNDVCGIHCAGAWLRHHETYNLGMTWRVRVPAAGPAARG